MDPFKFTTLAHRHHVFCNPLSDRTVDRCLGLMELSSESRVLDVGCGKGEFLIRLIERTGCRGVGVDVNAAFLAEAHTRAAARIPPERLVLHLADIAGMPPEPERYDAGLCIGSTHAFGTYRRTLQALSERVKPGGWILVGEGYWKREPDPGYLAFLGVSREDCTDHEGNVAAGIELDLVPIYAAVSSDADWDVYEDLYYGTMTEYLAGHPEDPDAVALTGRMEAWREAYLRWGRDTLGFGVYLFRS